MTFDHIVMWEIVNVWDGPLKYMCRVCFFAHLKNIALGNEWLLPKGVYVFLIILFLDFKQYVKILKQPKTKPSQTKEACHW